jgi:sugar phosphate permease
MSRIPIAIAAGLIGFFAYLASAVILADAIQTMHWAIQAVYFAIAGSVWVIPIRWLMFWSVHQR